MTNSQRLATIRDRLNRWIVESTGASQGEPINRESILIRDEFYVGRRFYTDSFRAVWFIEQDQLKIFSADHQLLCVMGSEEIDRQADTEPQNGPDVIKLSLPAEADQEVVKEIRRAA